MDLTLAWIGSSGYVNSLKLDFGIHLAGFVLSPMEREQSPLFSLPTIMSTHGEMMVAKCSKRFTEALNLISEGISQRHEMPGR